MRPHAHTPLEPFASHPPSPPLPSPQQVLLAELPPLSPEAGLPGAEAGAGPAGGPGRAGQGGGSLAQLTVAAGAAGLPPERSRAATWLLGLLGATWPAWSGGHEDEAEEEAEEGGGAGPGPPPPPSPAVAAAVARVLAALRAVMQGGGGGGGGDPQGRGLSWPALWALAGGAAAEGGGDEGGARSEEDEEEGEEDDEEDEEEKDDSPFGPAAASRLGAASLMWATAVGGAPAAQPRAGARGAPPGGAGAEGGAGLLRGALRGLLCGPAGLRGGAGGAGRAALLWAVMGGCGALLGWRDGPWRGVAAPGEGLEGLAEEGPGGGWAAGQRLQRSLQLLAAGCGLAARLPPEPEPKAGPEAAAAAALWSQAAELLLRGAGAGPGGGEAGGEGGRTARLWAFSGALEAAVQRSGLLPGPGLAAAAGGAGPNGGASPAGEPGGRLAARALRLGTLAAVQLAHGPRGGPQARAYGALQVRRRGLRGTRLGP